MRNCGQGRLNKAIRFIEENLEEVFDLERVANSASYSKFHFSRQFSAATGLGVQEFIRLKRLRKAANMLAFRTDPILAIALACGYESHEAFARAFRRYSGQSPSDFRACPNSSSALESHPTVIELRNVGMNMNQNISDVRVIDFPETPIALLDHKGDHMRLPATVRRFIDWRRTHGTSPERSATFNILYNDPEDVAVDDFRFGVACSHGKRIEDNAAGVRNAVIPAGRCAVKRHVGSTDFVGETLSVLYGGWLSENGEEPGDFPVFLQRLTFFPDVPEHKAETDVFLPLR